MNKKLKEKMKLYNKSRLVNIIKQQENFSKEIVNLASEIAIEKEILTEKDIDELPLIFKLEKSAINQIHLGWSPERIKDNLMEKAIDETIALKAMNMAANSVVIADKGKRDAKKEKISPFAIVLIVLALIKITISLMRLAN